MKYQNIAIVVFAILAASLFLYGSDENSSDLQKQFQRFKETYGKSYSKQEESYRLNVYAINKNMIQRHNSDKTQTYTMQLNGFADLTHQEFIEKILMNKLIPKNKLHIIDFKATNDQTQWDWSKKDGIVTSVKNQGSCGSCWSFSTTGALQSAIAIKKSLSVNLSQQQLVDCCGDRGYQCQGCNGAWPVWALDYINNVGIVQSTQYTYNAKKGTCKDQDQNIKQKLKKYLDESKPYVQLSQSDQSLVSGLTSQGPVSVCLDASNWSFYKSGIFSNCGNIQNHAVLLVGYDQNRWIIKNSWGDSWGQKGYISLAKPGNTCGLWQNAVIPMVN